jgi:multicomponent K+:H+ antiporter subunit D
MLSALLNPLGLGASGGQQPGSANWALLILLIGTGLLALIALTRIGILHFWAASDRAAPKLRWLEGLPVAALLAACVGLTVQAGPVMDYMQATARVLHTPAMYVQAVMSAQPVLRMDLVGRTGAMNPADVKDAP